MHFLDFAGLLEVYFEMLALHSAKASSSLGLDLKHW